MGKAKKGESRRLATATALLREVMEPGVFGPWHSVDDPIVGPILLPICKEHGYGAVMHAASALWRIHGPHPGSEHTAAACADVRRKMHERINAFLDATP